MQTNADGVVRVHMGNIHCGSIERDHLTDEATVYKSDVQVISDEMLFYTMYYCNGIVPLKAFEWAVININMWGCRQSVNNIRLGWLTMVLFNNGTDTCLTRRSSLDDYNSKTLKIIPNVFHVWGSPLFINLYGQRPSFVPSDRMIIILGMYPNHEVTCVLRLIRPLI
ncbi:hypothetical protein BDB01DRAFT_900669 [Pilobolus umbonatus]|nr:hypothetical protein BDB01DRAFT_900669 [Pilobolus umbonatus]